METSEASVHGPKGQHHPPNVPEDLVTCGQRIDRICNASKIAWAGGCTALTELSKVLDVRGRVNRNPYAMIAAAAGSGYVIGGGVFSPVTARLVGLGLRLGLRLAAIPVIQHELLGFAEVASTGGNGSVSPDKRTQQTTTESKESQYDESEESEAP
jgi:hypothetical protein